MLIIKKIIIKRIKNQETQAKKKLKMKNQKKKEKNLIKIESQ